MMMALLSFSSSSSSFTLSCVRLVRAKLHLPAHQGIRVRVV